MFVLFWLASQFFSVEVEVQKAPPALPAGHYLRHPPQYIPPSPAFPLPKELADMEAAGQAQNPKLVQVAYPVADLVVGNKPATDEEALIRFMVCTICPETWNNAGGPGTMDYFPVGMTLIINQTPEVHAKIQVLLKALRNWETGRARPRVTINPEEEQQFLDQLPPTPRLEPPPAARGDREAAPALTSVAYPVAEIVVPVEGVTPPIRELARTLPSKRPGQPARAECKGTCEDDLIACITQLVAPKSWKQAGGKGTIAYHAENMLLVVAQTADVQQKVKGFLKQIELVQTERYKEYRVEICQVVREKGNKFKEERWPAITCIRGQAIALGRSSKKVVDAGPPANTVRTPAFEVRRPGDPAAGEHTMDVGIQVQVKLVGEANGVRLEVAVQDQDYTEATRDYVLVTGQSYRLVQKVDLGKPITLVLETSKTGRPLRWLEFEVRDAADTEAAAPSLRQRAAGAATRPASK
jgi:hypothetical protein